MTINDADTVPFYVFTCLICDGVFASMNVCSEAFHDHVESHGLSLATYNDGSLEHLS